MEKQFISTRAFCLNAPLNAEEVGLELKKLGTFTPSSLVKIAENKKSPLHKYFEWDDTLAAEAYRLTQARHLVLAIGFDNDGEFSRAYESIVIDSVRAYAPMDLIQKTPALMDQVLQSVLREIIFWKDKHQRYKNIFGGIFDAITEAEATLRSSSNEKGKEGRKAKGRRKVRNPANKKANSKHNNSRGYATTR